MIVRFSGWVAWILRRNILSLAHIWGFIEFFPINFFFFRIFSLWLSKSKSIGRKCTLKFILILRWNRLWCNNAVHTKSNKFLKNSLLLLHNDFSHVLSHRCIECKCIKLRRRVLVTAYVILEMKLLNCLCGLFSSLHAYFPGRLIIYEYQRP